MENFIDLYEKKCQTYQRGRRGQHAAFISFIKKSIETKDEINKLLKDSVKNQSTRSEIISQLTPIIENHINKFAGIYNQDIAGKFSEDLNADLIYNQAREILPSQIIEEDGKKYIIGKRRGSNGGFVITEMLEIPKDIESEEGEEVSIEAIETEIEKANSEIEQAELKERRLEKYYYPYVQKWAQENGFERCEITGGLIPGPKWENPDLIEMYFDFGKNIAQINIEVTSFEVKLKIEPQAIWQAAHYSRFSHYTFVAFALTEEQVRSAERIFELAVNFGIGVLVLEERGQDQINFKLIHSPTKNNPPASEIETIISRFLGSEKIDPRFSNTKKQLLEEKSKFRKELLSGMSFTFGTTG